MYPKSVLFLSDEGEEEGFDFWIMDRYREKIARAIRSGGEPDAQTIRGGFLTTVETDEGDYISASWHWREENAVVFSVAPGFVEEPD